MSLTLIGLLQAAIGLLIVFRGSLNMAFAFLLFSSLLRGSSAIQLGALGNSSIPPAHFALLFVYLRLLMPRGGYAGAVPAALRANLPLVLFTFYGVVAAIAAPRIFAGAIDVPPLRFADARSLFDTFPLAPSPQNITTAVYIVGTLLIALAATIACRYRGGAEVLVRGGVLMAWIHAITGVLGVVSRGTPMEVVFDFFRNGAYAQLDQTYQGFVRMNGLLPEASTFASVGLAWFVFNCECWYRSVLPRATGRAALLLGVVLFFSTSSTAYIGLAGYGAVFVLRSLLLPQTANRRKLGEAAIALGGAVWLACIAMVLVPQLPAAVWDMILHMTVEKEDSLSGQQRLFWAMKGWEAFLASGGLGIGPGSFRSSSVVTAILGSMGVIGIATFGYYLWTVVQPQRLSTWGGVEDPGRAIGGAAAFTALMGLVPAAISAPSPDPGISFAIFAGAALALRPRYAGTGRHHASAPRERVPREAGSAPGAFRLRRSSPQRRLLDRFEEPRS